jgi:hypothetical protein
VVGELQKVARKIATRDHVLVVGLKLLAVYGQLEADG